MALSRLHRCMATVASAAAGERTRKAARSFLEVVQPAATAKRESPTPIIFTNGPWSTARELGDALPCTQTLCQEGYTTGFLDLPGYGRAASWPLAWTVDNIVEDIQFAFRPLAAAPIVIAQSSESLIYQKYLESFPLAGLVLLAPFPPNLTTLLNDLAASAGMPSTSTCRAIFHKLLSSQEAQKRLLLHSSASAECEEALFSRLESLLASDDSLGEAHLCGLDSALARMALVQGEEVNLEAQPVPMLCIVAEADGLLEPSHQKLSTPEYHAVRAEERAVIHGTGHDVVHSGATQRQAISTAIHKWIVHRF